MASRVGKERERERSQTFAIVTLDSGAFIKFYHLTNALYTVALHASNNKERIAMVAP